MPARRAPSDPRALGSAWSRFQRHAFPAPAPELAGVVAGYWIVEWAYDEPYEQIIVPLPNVQLTFHEGAAPEVHGVCSGHVTKVLEGRRRVLGVTFRPGGFRPFLGSAVSALTDRSVPASEIPALRGAPSGRVELTEVEEWLRGVLPPPDPTVDRVAGVVARVAAEPGIARVDELAARCATSVRTLQRLFAEYVGVSPKWVIRRHRLREVTERLAAGADIAWAPLATELGYSDQAHFVRDFAAIFGEPPTSYAARF
ncbi:helix-turn-helix domain-containing protein [Pseudonocardia sp. TRM90224]|uniref:helix-turn-helix domain-containing protein n=1 Tax=Pseudonocardia sp. TRM90224 TaxID=2812678 RepID=UPI001E3D206C|nr:helix-turn-helix domain-containing protein [Pseudonocardia sp. TRM90224]